MSREKFEIPAKCVGCRKLREWDLRLDGIDDLIEKVPDEAAEVAGTDDMERYMAMVDTDEGHYLHKREVGLTAVKYLIGHCDGFSTRKDVVDVSGPQEVVDPLVVDIPQCGIPDVEWQELNYRLAHLPLEGEDE
jgi:hypothetical protein